MKSITSLLALAATISSTSAYWSGFNSQATLANGACKSQADWENDFNLMKRLTGFTSLRLYASSDCDTLARAVPAAIKTGGTILVGVWTEDQGHFDREKAALLAAVRQYGFGWIVAVSVGSEDLYRKDTIASTLAGQIYDVRGMLTTVNGYSTNVQVGHVDTWTAWVDPANKAVIRACDFVGTDGYPYFQNTQENPVDQGYNLFWESIRVTRQVVDRVKPGVWVWNTESGWPTSGKTENKAVPSVANAQRYWKDVACSSFASMHTFWYSLQDFNASPSFGVADGNGNALYDLKC